MGELRAEPSELMASSAAPGRAAEGRSGLVQWLARWSRAPDARHCVLPPWVQGAALLWVLVTVPFFFALAFFVDTPRWYLFVLIFFACGAYTTPALVVSSYAAHRSPPRDRPGYLALHLGLVVNFCIGVGVLIGLATGWRWGNHLVLPAIVLSGSLHCGGLALVLRNHSGGRALSVDALDALAVTVAVCAPAALLWGPEVMDAEARWFALPAATIVPFMTWGMYWAVMLVVRVGPGRGPVAFCALTLGFTGLVNAALQTAQGVSGFALPAPPLIALNALCFSMCLLLPLHRTVLMEPGLGRLPPQAQVRGARLSTAVVLAGLAWLTMVTATAGDEEPWVWPFAAAVAATLVVLGGLRQIATVDETRRLYQQVEEASEERRYLLDQLLEQSMRERQDFAGHLYERSVAAYTSFRTLAGAEGGPDDDRPSAVGAASDQVVGSLARQAESARRLMVLLRQAGGDSTYPRQLSAPVTAYLTTLYGDAPSPRLSLSVADGMVLDWMTETMFLQIIREALDNVWRHSQAQAVDLVIGLDGSAVSLEVSDDGVGFEPGTVTEGSGLPTMKALAALIGGTLSVTARPGDGVTVTARVEPGRESSPEVETEAAPVLRLVRGARDRATRR